MTRAARALAGSLTAMLALVLGLAVVATPSGAATSAPAPSLAPAAPPLAIKADAPQLTVVQQTSWVALGETWTLVVRVHAAPAGSTVTVRVHEPVQSRDAFLQTLDGSALPGVRLTLPVIAMDTAPLTTEGDRLATVAIPVREGRQSDPTALPVYGAGVLPVSVTLTSTSGANLDRLVTHLLRLPDTDQQTLPVVTSLVLDVHAPPAHAELTTTTAGGTIPSAPVTATTSLSATERLSLAQELGVLGSHPNVPVTLQPTPETVEALSTTTSRPDLAAELRLARARGDDVLAGPYVHLDEASWLASGLSSELGYQRQRGATVLRDHLGSAADRGNQVLGPTVTNDLVAFVHRDGAQRLVVPETSLAALPNGALPRALTRPFLLDAGGNQLPAVQIDRRLQQGFTRHPDDPVLAGHQLLAELASIDRESPSAIQGVVLSPPAGATPDARLLEVLLSGLEQGTPVVAPATVDAMFTLVPLAGRSSAIATSGPRLVRTLAPASPAGLGDLPQQLTTSRSLVASYASLLGDPLNRELVTLDTSVLVAGSEDLTTAQRTARLASTDTVLRARLGSVEVPAGQTVTLTSTDGSIPLTVRNRLPYAAGIVIRLDASKRIEFPDLPGPGRAPCSHPEPGNTLDCVIPASTTARLSVRVRVKGSGVTPLIVTVRAPNGFLLQPPSRYRVQSTAVSGVGLVITIGAAAFLAVWWARHWHRNRNAPPSPDAPDAAAS